MGQHCIKTSFTKKVCVSIDFETLTLENLLFSQTAVVSGETHLYHLL